MASRAWQVLRTLQRPEREAISALRKASAGDAAASTNRDDALPAAFLALGTLLKQLGLRTGDVDAPYVTLDERLAIAGIAVLQRPQLTLEFRDRAIGLAFARCAEALAAQGRRLAFNGEMITLLDQRGWLVGRSEAARASSSGQVAQSTGETARARIIRYGRDHDRMSLAELQKLGVTRQYVSLLCRAGLIERVALGYYCLSGRHQA